MQNLMKKKDVQKPLGLAPHEFLSRGTELTKKIGMDFPYLSKNHVIIGYVMGKFLKKAAKPFAVKPSIYAACVELTTGNTVAGGLLCQIALRSEGKALKDEHNIEGWLVLSIQQWRYVTGFSRHQYNDALRYLKKNGLIQYRRRKLKYKDRAALGWVRLADNAKSSIGEIMSRPAISAFAEEVSNNASDIAEKTALPISDKPDALNKMNILENDNESENVVIEETTTPESISNKKQKKQKGIKKEVSRKDWFNSVQKDIYQASGYCAYIR